MLKPFRWGLVTAAAALLGVVSVASNASAYQTGYGQLQLVSMLDPSTPQCIGSDSNAVITKAYPPQYPEIALAQGLEGFSLITFTMGLDGSVSDAKLAGTSGNRLFDRAAVEAVKKSHFAPAVRNCAKISGVYGIQVVFAKGPAPYWGGFMNPATGTARGLVR